MIRQRFKRVLLVAPDNCPRRLSAEYKHVKHIVAASQIFPAIFELKPDLILFDHEHVKGDIEQIVRRLRSNTFYKKTRVCCYKQRSELKHDELLKTIGVNYFIYADDLKSDTQAEQHSIFSAILDASLMRILAKAAN